MTSRVTILLANHNVKAAHIESRAFPTVHACVQYACGSILTQVTTKHGWCEQPPQTAPQSGTVLVPS